MPENGALLLPIAVLFQQAISFPQFTLIMLLLGKLGRIPLHYVFPPCITNQTYRRLQEHFSKKFKQPPLKCPQVCSSRQPTRRRAGKIHYSTLVSQTGMVTVHQVSAPFSKPASRCNLKRTKGPSRPRPRAFLGVSRLPRGLAHSSRSRAFLEVSRLPRGLASLVLETRKLSGRWSRGRSRRPPRRQPREMEASERKRRG